MQYPYKNLDRIQFFLRIFGIFRNQWFREKNPVLRRGVVGSEKGKSQFLQAAAWN